MSKPYKVGYKKPPSEHTWKKGGPSPNPAGRKKKEPKKNDAALLMKEIGSETITIGGRDYLKLEAMLRALYAKAMRNDLAAIRLYIATMEKLGLLRPIEAVDRRGGVLVVPGMASLEDWEEEASQQQAKFRGEDPEGLARLTGIPPACR